MIGLNGGLLGAQRSTNTSTGPGMWVGNEQVLLRRANTWPRTDDPYATSVSLLLHMDGSNGSTTFTDSSSNALTVTANGNAQISTTQSKFGGASGSFDGNGDYLNIATNALLDFGTGDWTVEFWMYYAGTANAYPCILGVTTGWSAGVVSIAHDHSWAVDKLSVTANSHNTGAPVVSSSTLSLNTWYHCAVVRSGTLLKIYINGTNDGSATISSGLTFNFSTGATRIGGNNGDGAASYFNGYLDDMRITKGVARYTANFTAPTVAYPNP